MVRSAPDCRPRQRNTIKGHWLGYTQSSGKAVFCADASISLPSVEPIQFGLCLIPVASFPIILRLHWFLFWPCLGMETVSKTQQISLLYTLCTLNLNRLYLATEFILDLDLYAFGCVKVNQFRDLRLFNWIVLVSFHTTGQLHALKTVVPRRLQDNSDQYWDDQKDGTTGKYYI